MANNCSNIITITEKKDTELYAIFDAWLQAEEGIKPEGHLPQLIGFDDNDRYFFDIVRDDDGHFWFISKWTAAVSSMVKIALAYKFSFRLEFEEMGMLEYGEYEFDYNTKKLKLRQLDPKDIPDDDGTCDNYFDNLDELLEKTNWEPINIVLDGKSA